LTEVGQTDAANGLAELQEATKPL